MKLVTKNSNIGRGNKKIVRKSRKPGVCVTFKFNDALNRFINERGMIVSKNKVLG